MILETMSKISPVSSEVTAPNVDSLIIGSIEETIAAYGSPKFCVSDQLLNDMIEFDITEIPLIPQRRQCISLAFAPIWVSCVGFTTEMIAEIVKYVSLLGGSFSRKYSTDVSLLIATTNFSPKVFTARREGIPIVSYEWLTACFKEMVRVDVQSYLIEPFLGYTFTSSDLTPNESKQAKMIIHQNGGSWQDHFDNNVNFLLANHITTTKKIFMALGNQVPIVRTDWLLEPTSPPDQFVINFWSISEQKRDLFQSLSFSIHRNCENIDALQDAIISNSGEIGKSPTQIKIVPHGVDISIPDSIIVTPQWIWKCIEANSLVNFESSVLYRPIQLKLPIKDAMDQYFFVSNLKDDLRIHITELIRICGGIVVYKMSVNTHFVIAYENDTSTIKTAIRKEIPVVTPQFVIHMIKKGELPDLDQFQANKGVKKVMLHKLCDLITKVGAAQTDDSLEEELSPESEKKDLDAFTQDLPNSTQNDMTLDIGYDVPAVPNINPDTMLSNDQFLNALDYSVPQEE